MSFSNFNTTFNGNPLNKVPYNAPSVIYVARDPGPKDLDYKPGSEWQNTTTGVFWKCISVFSSGAVWEAFTGGPSGDVTALQGNSGGRVGPNAGLIKVVGDGTTIDVAGDPTDNKLTISVISSGEVSSITATAPLTANGVSGAAQTGAVTIAVPDATTTTLGVASFNTTNFTVSSGAVTSKNFTINTTSPLSGGGAITLGGTLTLSISGSGYVSSITGTANEILANAATTAQTGAVTLTIPTTFVAPGSIAATTSLATGMNSGTNGSVLLNGSASGTITVQSQPAAGTYNFNLPIDAGTSGYYLTSAGGGSSAMTWTNPPTSSVTFTGDSGTPFTGNAVTVTGGTTGLTFNAASPALTLTGTLVVSNGGTGQTSLTQHGLLVGNGTSGIQVLGVGTQNYLLQGNTGANPSFTNTPSVTSIDIASVDSMDPNAGVNVGYLSGIISGLTFKQAVVVATTGSNLNATYANGAAGVGATLTNAGANAAFALDGVTTSSGNRVLIKDQSSALQNGIYSVTTEGDGSTAWVLTRTTDFNSPSTIVAGSLVPVESGTVNANTSWIETQTITTVGTDSVLFAQFTYGPSTFLIKANNLSDVPSPSTARSNLGLTNIATQTTTNHDVLVGAASNGITNVSPSTSGFVLTSNGVGSDPSFQSVSSSGAVTTVNGDTGSATPSSGTLTIKSNQAGNNSGESVSFSGSGSTLTLNLTDGNINTFIGNTCGNSATGQRNAGFGAFALNSGTGIAQCIGFGSSALSHLVNGAGTIGIGFNAGSSYTGSESGNVLIGTSQDGTAGENNVTRIATGNSKCFLGGISGVTGTSSAVVVGLNTSTQQLLQTTITAGTGVSVTAGGGTITIAATGTTTLTITPVNHAASPYTVLTTDEYLAVDVSGGVVTLKLPNAPSSGRVYTIKDSTGNAATSNISVTTVGGAVTIDGQTTYTMNGNYQSISVIFNGSNYEVF